MLEVRRRASIWVLSVEFWLPVLALSGNDELDAPVRCSAVSGDVRCDWVELAEADSGQAAAIDTPLSKRCNNSLCPLLAKNLVSCLIAI